jgi:hypothetical protein
MTLMIYLFIGEEAIYDEAGRYQEQKSYFMVTQTFIIM